MADITLEQAKAAVKAAVAKSAEIGTKMDIAVVATLAGGQEVLLIIDTGANNAVSLPSHTADWPRILASRAASPGASRGVGGTILTQQSWLRHIDLLGLRLADVPVSFEPQPPGLSSPHYPVGRIGTQLLNAFTPPFDLENRAISLQFAPEAAESND